MTPTKKIKIQFFNHTHKELRPTFRRSHPYLKTVRQLASNGFTVVLTARDEKRGLEAVEKLKESGLSGQVVFHQLDVANPATVASLADFIKTQFGKLDILVCI